MMNRSHICLLSRNGKMNNSSRKSFHAKCAASISFFCVHKRNLDYFLLAFRSNVCSFNEKANSKKLFARIGFSVYFQTRKIRKSSWRSNESIIRFESVWWFIDGNCTIGLSQCLWSICMRILFHLKQPDGLKCFRKLLC